LEEFAELICITDKPYVKRIFDLLNQELLYLKQPNIQIPTVEMVGMKEIKHSQSQVMSDSTVTTHSVMREKLYDPTMEPPGNHTK